MSGTCRFTVLYTSQKTKKAKTWHDGILHACNRTKILFDSDGQLLETFLTTQKVAAGDELESDKYMINVEDQIEPSKAGSIGECAPKDTSPREQVNSLGYGEHSKTYRGPKGFVPPRRTPCSEPKVMATEGAAGTHVGPVTSAAPKRMNIFTLYADTAAASNQEAADSRCRPMAAGRDNALQCPSLLSQQRSNDALHTEHAQKRSLPAYSSAASAPKRTAHDILALVRGKKPALCSATVDRNDLASSKVNDVRLRETDRFVTPAQPWPSLDRPLAHAASPITNAAGSINNPLPAGSTVSPMFDLAIDECDDDNGSGNESEEHSKASRQFSLFTPEDAGEACLASFDFALDEGSLCNGSLFAAPKVALADSLVQDPVSRGVSAIKELPASRKPCSDTSLPADRAPVMLSANVPAFCYMDSDSLLFSSDSSLHFPAALCTSRTAVKGEGGPLRSNNSCKENVGGSPRFTKMTTHAANRMSDYKPRGAVASGMVQRQGNVEHAIEREPPETAKADILRSMYSKTLDPETTERAPCSDKPALLRQPSKWDAFASHGDYSCSVTGQASQRALYDQWHENGEEQVVPVDFSLFDGSANYLGMSSQDVYLQETCLYDRMRNVMDLMPGEDISGREQYVALQEQQVPINHKPRSDHRCWKYTVLTPPPELCFPEQVESGQPTPKRLTVIPHCFASAADYKCVMETAVTEHLNIVLLELASMYHAAAKLVDVSICATDSSAGQAGAMLSKLVQSSSSEIKCTHGTACKMVQVKKEGPNKGRYFFACSHPRASQCKFFKWLDDKNGNAMTPGTSTMLPRTLDTRDSVNSYFMSKGISMYCCCQLSRIPEHPVSIKWKSGMKGKGDQKQFFIQLSRRGTSGEYSKDDLWIISLSMKFEPALTAIARSVFFGPNADNAIELEVINSCHVHRWPEDALCHAIHLGNVSTELRCNSVVREITLLNIPMLPWLLCMRSSLTSQGRSQQFVCPSPRNRLHICLPWQCVVREADSLVERYKLNECQAGALRSIAEMFNKDGLSTEKPCPVKLIQGVFGAGKSFLLAVIIIFLSKVLEMNDSYQRAPSTTTTDYSGSRILLSSLTNVAVDRVLTSLLSLGFEDFVRVGSLKKLNKTVLPYSMHASGGANSELKELQEMLKSGDATPSEKQYIRKTIEKHKLGENKKKLKRVRVIGVTCAACDFPVLDDMRFAIVVLDECSQLTEPVSLLPLVRAHCEQLVLVGDPRQLSPSVQGSSSGHQQGLEQTLFDRLVLMGYPTVKLNIQYRCHPVISAVANSLFYEGQLVDGVTAEQRPALVPDLGHLSFFDVSSGHQECSSDSNSFCNQKEAETVVCLVDILLGAGLSPSSIGVITLYRSQVQLIKTCLESNSSADMDSVKAVQVSTVDAFQGGEKDVIILSCVRTDQMGFADDAKRTNVALTRAKHHLIILGNKKNLLNNGLWSKVLEHCQASPGGIQRADTVCKRWAAMNTQVKKSAAAVSARDSTANPADNPADRWDQHSPEMSSRAGNADNDDTDNVLETTLHDGYSPLCSPSGSLPLDLSDDEFQEEYSKAKLQLAQQDRTGNSQMTQLQLI